MELFVRVFLWIVFNIVSGLKGVSKEDYFTSSSGRLLSLFFSKVLFVGGFVLVNIIRKDGGKGRGWDKFISALSTTAFWG